MLSPLLPGLAQTFMNINVKVDIRPPQFEGQNPVYVLEAGDVQGELFLAILNLKLTKFEASFEGRKLVIRS